MTQTKLTTGGPPHEASLGADPGLLDANILFSAAWREGSGLLVLWDKPNVQLVTSAYALMEAGRNLSVKKPAALVRLSQLAASVEVSAATRRINAAHGLPDKDLPILEAAVGSGCRFLLTGDIAHFGHLIEVDLESVTVLTASLFLAAL